MDSYFHLHGVTLRLSADRDQVMGPVGRFLEAYGLTPCPPCAPTLVMELATDTAAPAETGPWQPLGLAGLSVMTAGEVLEARDDQARASIDCGALRARVAVSAGVGDQVGMGMNLVCYSLLTLLRRCGLYPLHGAGLACNGVGVLLVGDSGQGKSTLAAALLRSGWGLLSDDSLLLRHDGQAVEALPMRRGLFLAAEGSTDPTPAGTRPAPVKVRVATERAFPGRALERCTPRLVVFPAVRDRDVSELLACPPDQAIHLLAHHGQVAEMERGRARQNMAALAALVRQCRCCRLEAGRDLLADPGLAARLLSDLLAPAVDAGANPGGQEGVQ